MFTITNSPIDLASLRLELEHPQAGGLVVFEGVVRNHHQGRAVLHLAYEGHAPLAIRQGEKILAEAAVRWPLLRAIACHRLGHLEVGEAAVWIGVASAHRAEAFSACAWIMDQVKTRVPVWKKETLANGTVEWNQGTTMQTAAPE